MKKTVFCLVESEVSANSLVQKVLRAGFSSADISVAMPSEGVSNNPTFKRNARAGEVGGAGANPREILGGSLGCVAHWELTMPKMGPLIAAGPLLAALSGTAGETTIDRLFVAFIKMGILEFDARTCADEVQTGRLWIAVDTHANDEARRAAAIFTGSGELDHGATSEVVVPWEKAASGGVALDGL